MKKYDAIVIGGGAAGMMAAVTAGRMGRDVLLLEQNSVLGKKLKITGKGRCNVTNACDNDTLMKNIPGNSRFLFSAFSQFSTQDTMTFFEDLGVPLKIERGNRVFPVSDRAEDITSAFSKALRDADVTVSESRAIKIITEDGAVRGVLTDSGEYYSESVLIATGGKSYPQTGSTGDGYRMAIECGHTVTAIRPSLVPLVIKEGYCREMMGLSLKNVTLNLYDTKDNKLLFSELGEMLFTHFGVSGPLVLSAGAHIRDMAEGRYRMEIDLKPALEDEKLDLRIQRDFSENINKDYFNSLRKLLPAKMIPIVVRLSEIPPELKVNQITKQQRRKLLEVLKHFPLTIKDFRPVEEAIVTSGGVSVREISPKTMESKLVNGLYFAGEVIDVDAYTGGFNLQIAFSTGYSAGMNL